MISHMVLCDCCIADSVLRYHGP